MQMGCFNSLNSKYFIITEVIQEEICLTCLDAIELSLHFGVGVHLMFQLFQGGIPPFHNLLHVDSRLWGGSRLLTRHSLPKLSLLQTEINTLMGLDIEGYFWQLCKTG